MGRQANLCHASSPAISCSMRHENKTEDLSQGCCEGTPDYPHCLKCPIVVAALTFIPFEILAILPVGCSPLY